MKEIVPERHCDWCDGTVFRYRGQDYRSLESAEEAQRRYTEQRRRKRLAWTKT